MCVLLMDRGNEVVQNVFIDELDWKMILVEYELCVDLDQICVC